VKAIELPVCILFFPDLYEGSPVLTKGTDLISVCRDIFLVVNKNAIPVTESRSVLLDDEDISARLMRQTLSALKNRSGQDYGLSRIYSLSYGDSDTDLGKQVVHGQLEYSTAIALHKLHAAISFGRMDAFNWNATIDITDGRNARNSSRPAEMLLGTKAQHLPTISRKSGKSIPPKDVKEVVERLGELADGAILPLFDGLRPFEIHNRVMRTMRDRLSDSHVQADAVQKKCLSLIFEGSGVRNVFYAHVARLKAIRDERRDEGLPLEDSLVSQITFCDAVAKALAIREAEVHRSRSCAFFQVDEKAFYEGDPRPEHGQLEEKARRFFQTVSTQAFQLGHCMAVFTAVEELKRQNCTGSEPLQFDKRKELVAFVSRVFIAGLNRYFSPEESSTHRTLTGYFKDPRASVFDQNALGLRGLFAMKGGELNERQWPFFRYLVLELVHSKHAWQYAAAAMGDAGIWCVGWYRNTLPSLVAGILADRARYVRDAVEARLADREFRTLLDQRRYQEQGAGKEAGEIEATLSAMEAEKRAEAEGIAASHLKASLGAVETQEAMLERLASKLLS
jgi:hypothetical protein